MQLINQSCIMYSNHYVFVKNNFFDSMLKFFLVFSFVYEFGGCFTLCYFSICDHHCNNYRFSSKHNGRLIWLTHDTCYMYCSYSCCFPCSVSLTKPYLSQSVLKGEQCLSVITNSFFSFYANSEKMCCVTVSHNGCDCVTLLFYSSINAHPKTPTGLWHDTDTMFNSAACIHVSEINLVVL